MGITLKVNITLPVYNEENTLEKTIKLLLLFLKTFPYSYEIVIADNASIDNTPEIGKLLSKKYNCVKYFRLEQKGRGRALKTVWGASKCNIVSYMDIDLSTDIKAFPLLIEACKVHDFSTGSRYLSGSKVVRSRKRGILSNSYNFLIRNLLRSKVYDHQCGFKAAKKSSFIKILPLLYNNNWFFDTELLINAQRKEFSVVEIPVTWYEDKMRDSKVNIVQTIKEYLFNILRMVKI